MNSAAHYDEMAIDELFRSRFKAPPVALTRSPGRVNLMGDHTDYNQGLALPMTIDRFTTIAAAPSSESRSTLRVWTGLTDATIECPLDAIETLPLWARYVAGTTKLCLDAGLVFPRNLDIAILSDIPVGSGLSSSASLCVGIATLLGHLAGHTLDAVEKARLCQRVEHEFAGVPCGIMDQYVIAASSPGSAILLDCQSTTHTDVPLDTDEVAVLIADTHKPRNLAESLYAKRVAECREAAQSLGVTSLRELEPDTVRSAPTTTLKRARHVVTECQRTREFASSLQRRDWHSAGDAMYESHRSLHQDYEITGPALDAVVKCAKGIGTTGGVWGARMTGAGMGGCAVLLVDANQTEQVATELSSAYAATTGDPLTVFAVRPGGPAATHAR